MCTSRLLSFVLLLGALAPATWAQTTLVHCGTLLDPGVSLEPMTERTIIVEGDRVVRVAEGFLEASSNQATVDLRSSYCLPGLIDMHVHLTGESRPNGYIDRFTVSAPEAALRAVPYAHRTLMAGFTTVRDVGSGEGVGFALRNAINRGDVVGPRMFVSGGSLAIMGGHGDPTNGGREDLLGIPSESQGVVNGVDSAIRGSRLAIKRGADVIKITATGGVLSVARDGSAPQFFEDEIRAIVDVATPFGIKVTAHAHGDEGMRRAVAAGVSSIEHGTFMSPETMALMRERGAYLVATITAGMSVADSAQIAGYYVPVVREKALRIGPQIQDKFGEAYRAGVPIAFGTDAGVFRHGRNAKEFEYMVEAGMPAAEALRAATYHAANLLGQLDQLGTLEGGKLADIVALSGDPLADITVIQTGVDFVMKAGVVYKQEGQATTQ
ncbi:MAG: amidohydrolase family protein [Bacteroidota bacterium]